MHIYTEPIVNNSIFHDLLWFREGFSGYHTIYFKDVTSLFYNFKFNWGSCYQTQYTLHQNMYLFIFVIGKYMKYSKNNYESKFNNITYVH